MSLRINIRKFQFFARNELFCECRKEKGVGPQESQRNQKKTEKRDTKPSPLKTLPFSHFRSDIPFLFCCSSHPNTLMIDMHS